MYYLLFIAIGVAFLYVYFRNKAAKEEREYLTAIANYQPPVFLKVVTCPVCFGIPDKRCDCEKCEQSGFVSIPETSNFCYDEMLIQLEWHEYYKRTGKEECGLPLTNCSQSGD